MKYVSYLNTASHILGLYSGDEPFAHFIRNFFRQNKKFGSTDRRMIGNSCYCYFRLGHSLKNISVEEKILIGIFLCNSKPNELLNHFKSTWNEMIHLPLTEKLSAIKYQFLITDIFPLKDDLSGGIDHEKLCASFLSQPDLFLRIRPGNQNVVTKKLTDNNIEFNQITESCIVLNNSTKINEIIDLNKEAVIQDYNSQQTGNFFRQQTSNARQGPISAWDCCAASGGKSIMLYDIYPDVELTVSDIRGSIMVNLKKRFSEAGLKRYASFVSDLSTTNHKLPIKNYDLVLADVPCSGSGTWSRTPESLLFFKEREIARYNELQKRIISNIIPSLKKDGRLIYITCSVFKKENEDIVEFIQQNQQLKLQKMELLKGYEIKADSMFGAIFTV